MKYFLFDADDDIVAASITNEHGDELARYGENPKFWDVGRRLVHVPYLDSDDDIQSPSQLTDAIGIGLEVVVSKALAECLQQFSFDDAVMFLPVEIVNRSAQVISTDYQLLVSQTWQNVLDAEASGAELFDDGAIDQIESWVLDRALVPDFDWFYAHEYSWVINDKVRSSFVKSRISNARLTSVSVK